MCFMVFLFFWLLISLNLQWFHLNIETNGYQKIYNNNPPLVLHVGSALPNCRRLPSTRLKVKDAGSLQSMLSADEWQSVRSLSVKDSWTVRILPFWNRRGWLRSIFLNWTMPPWCHALFRVDQSEICCFADALTAIANGAFRRLFWLESLSDCPKGVSYRVLCF